MPLEYQLGDYDGKIAVYGMWTRGWDVPEYTRNIWVFEQPSENFGDLELFYRGEHVGSNIVTFFNSVSRRYTSFLCAPEEGRCSVVFQRRDVPPPGRGGKDWSWHYSCGEWVKGSKSIKNDIP